MEQRVFEATWEEIASHAAELAGRRLRVTLVADEQTVMLDRSLAGLLEAAEELE